MANTTDYSDAAYEIQDALREGGFGYVPAARYIDACLKAGKTSAEILAAYRAYVASFGGDAVAAFTYAKDGGQGVMNLLIHGTPIQLDSDPATNVAHAAVDAGSAFAGEVFAGLKADGFTAAQVASAIRGLLR